jgi:mannose-1-phosphate guanylyltransferase
VRAFLLAAGVGNRLLPVTKYVPKCLVPINGKPLMSYWLDSLLKSGVNDILVNVHYLPQLVQQYIDKHPYKDRIRVVIEEKLLGTAGSVKKNNIYFQDEDFLLIHADNLCFADLSKFISAHQNRPNGTVMTMMTFRTNSPETCGIVELDKKNICTGFQEKPTTPLSDLANAAVYIIGKEVVCYILSLKNEFIDFSTEVIPHFMKKIYIWENSNYHRDIGNLESYGLSQIETFV